MCTTMVLVAELLPSHRGVNTCIIYTVVSHTVVLPSLEQRDRRYEVTLFSLCVTPSFPCCGSNYLSSCAHTRVGAVVCAK